YRTERQARLQSFRWYLQPVYELLEHGANLGRTAAEKERGWAASQRGDFRKWAQDFSRRRVVGIPVGWLIFALSFWPIIWVLWAFLARGGFSFRMLGLSLVQSNGRRASRIRCAWRVLLICAPVVLLL